MRTPTLYEILGVNPSASPEEIRAAHREGVKRYHPDQHLGSPLADLATEKLAQMNEAYETLSDPQKRAAYDASLSGYRQTYQVRKPSSVWRTLGTLVGGILVLRFGLVLFRGLLVLLRALFQGLESLAGTPIVGLLFLAVIGTLVFYVVKRGKSSTRKDR